MTKTYFNSDEKMTVDNYPYGRLKCEMTFWVEHNPKHGFRACRQSVNPKTGRTNKPKKGTYSDLILMYKDNDCGHIKFEHHSFNGTDALNNAFLVLNIHFRKFSPEIMKESYIRLLGRLKQTFIGTVSYRKANKEKLWEVFEPVVIELTKGLKNGHNHFKGLELNVYAINETIQKD